VRAPQGPAGPFLELVVVIRPRLEVLAQRILSKGIPQYQALAVVPTLSATPIAGHHPQVRRKHKLLNILDGQAHSEESRSAIREGLARVSAAHSFPTGFIGLLALGIPDGNGQVPGWHYPGPALLMPA